VQPGSQASLASKALHVGSRLHQRRLGNVLSILRVAAELRSRSLHLRAIVPDRVGAVGKGVHLDSPGRAIATSFSLEPQGRSAKPDSEPASLGLVRPNLTVVTHPTVAHRLAEVRDQRTGRDRFRDLIAEISMFLAYEALGELGTSPRAITTPVGTAQVLVVTEEVLVIPVLRAGLGMVPGVQRVAPNCEVAHLGMKRDESTLDAVCYLDGLPADLAQRRVVVCDPMLATGGSLAQACRLIEGRGATRITALCLVASEPGLRNFSTQMPGVAVFCAAVDVSLDDRGYIVPGLGDAGDRLFGPPGDGLSALHGQVANRRVD